MKITGAIFDFDGTLFDSMHIWKGIKYKYIKKLGLELTKEDSEAFKGLYLREALLFAKERFDIKKSYEELLNDFFDFIKEEYLVDATPKNDIVEFLQKLKDKGIRMGIATATGESALEPLLEKYGLRDYFSEIYSTYTVGASKHESKVYDVVLEKLDTDKETTWVFEDAFYAASTAKKSGYNVVGIFDKSEENAERLKQIVDIYIHNYNELNLD